MDIFSEAAAQKCNLLVRSLAQSLRLRYADGRLDSNIGKTTAVKCQLYGDSGPIYMTRDFYVGPVHHDIILGMPWMTQWEARPQPKCGRIEVSAPGKNEKIHLSISPIEYTSSMVSGVQSVPFDNKDGPMIGQQLAAGGEGEGMHASFRRKEPTKAAILKDSIQLAAAAAFGAVGPTGSAGAAAATRVSAA